MDYLLENHKLMHHLPLVVDWLNGESVVPLTVEVSPSSKCNHSCLMCGYEHLGHTRGQIPRDLLVKISGELAQSGVKGIVFAGDGEPFLNKGLLDAVQSGKNNGADVAISSNGILIREEFIPLLVENLTWLRFSVNGVADSYAKVHRCMIEQYQVVIDTMSKMVVEKYKKGSNVTIGVQMVMLPENIEDALTLAQTVKRIGVDYFVLKPFYFNDKNKYGHEFSLNYENYSDYFSKIEDLSTDEFYCKVRHSTIAGHERAYTQCLGWPFMLYVRSDGELMPCLARHFDDDLSLGSLRQESVMELLTKRHMTRVADAMSQIDIQTCQPNCRHHNINKFLWQVSQEVPHKNFI